jgi:hypothetical protein
MARVGSALVGVVLWLAGASGAVAAAPPPGGSPAEATAGSSTPHHYEYLFSGGTMRVYDMDEGQALVQEVKGMPDTDGVRGAMVDAATHTLYISHGGDGPTGSFDGSLLAYDLVSGKILWNREYPFPIDSGAMSADGTKIYMPSGENDTSGVWNVLAAGDGEPIGTIQGGAGAHNTITSLDGKLVYLGGRDSSFLDVASTETDQVVQRIGPLVGGVRPFTVNGTDTLAYTTATEFLGFQVSSVITGKVLYTVEFPGLTTPYPFSFSAPSHGITLTPDEQRLYVFDAVSEEVRMFDVSGVPAEPPLELPPVGIAPIAGEQSECGYDCTKSGWLQSSLDGRFVYVGDSGSVIDASTDTLVAEIPALAQTRVMLEVDWADGAPIATSTRYGLGHVTGLPAIPPPATPAPPATASQAPAALPSGSSAGSAGIASGAPGSKSGGGVTCTVSLAGKHLAVAHRRSIGLRLTRTGSPGQCRGVVTIRYREARRGSRIRLRSIGRARFSIGAVGSNVIDVSLNGLGRALLRNSRGGLRAIVALLRTVPAPIHETSVNVRLGWPSALDRPRAAVRRLSRRLSHVVRRAFAAA